MLLVICLVPLAVLIIYLLVMTNRFSMRYDAIVQKITMVNDYNIDFRLRGCGLWDTLLCVRWEAKGGRQSVSLHQIRGE